MSLECVRVSGWVCALRCVLTDVISVLAEVGLLLPHAASVIEFIEAVATDPDKSDSVTCAACGLIG